MHTTHIHLAGLARWYAAANVQNWYATPGHVADWYHAAAKNAEMARTGESARAERMPPRSYEPRAVSAPPSIASVMACIRAHESGDYTIHNHGYSGSSGAYQYLRSTWLSWSARAGYGGYDAAYLAPPSVQDAVTVYALTHGGAGNWSMRWGNDPCTRGLPGGG